MINSPRTRTFGIIFCFELLVFAAELSVPTVKQRLRFTWLCRKPLVIFPWFVLWAQWTPYGRLVFFFWFVDCF